MFGNKLEVPISDYSFEQFLRSDRLMGVRCQSCGSLFVPPRMLCFRCFGTDMNWEQMQGTGRLAGFTSITIGPSFMVEEGFDRTHPYCTGVVELIERTRVVARIEGVFAQKPESIVVGTPMQVKFLHVDGSGPVKTFLAFEPVSTS